MGGERGTDKTDKLSNASNRNNGAQGVMQSAYDWLSLKYESFS